jgi:hypothetical protein
MSDPAATVTLCNTRTVIAISHYDPFADAAHGES